MSSGSGVVICSLDYGFCPDDYRTKTLIQVENPKLEFVRILQAFFAPEPPRPSLHPTAIVHPEAKLHSTVSVGPFCCVGKAEVGAGTVIHAHTCIHDEVRIGENVLIHSGCVLGAAGFGFVRNEQGVFEKFLQVGRLIIGDNVEIQSLTNVDRGGLKDTVIGMGTKIDTGCHIGHNVRIGKHCAIAGHTLIAGSTTIGDEVFIGPSSVLRNRIKVGSGSFIGFGSVVTKDVPDGARIMGTPARRVEDYKKMLATLKRSAEVV